jgi:hypothetical protein
MPRHHKSDRYFLAAATARDGLQLGRPPIGGTRRVAGTGPGQNYGMDWAIKISRPRSPYFRPGPTYDDNWRPPIGGTNSNSKKKIFRIFRTPLFSRKNHQNSMLFYDALVVFLSFDDFSHFLLRKILYLSELFRLVFLKKVIKRKTGRRKTKREYS